MILDTMHPEDVKAGLRKQYGSIRKFVDAHGLPKTGVSDFLRGRTSRPVRKAIEEALADSRKLDTSKAKRRAHRGNGGDA